MKTVEEIREQRKKYPSIYRRNIECEISKPDELQHPKLRDTAKEAYDVFDMDTCFECERRYVCSKEAEESMYRNDDPPDPPCLNIEDYPQRPYKSLTWVYTPRYYYWDKVLTEAREAYKSLDRDIPEIYEDCFEFLREYDDKPFWQTIGKEICGEDCYKCQAYCSCQIRLSTFWAPDGKPWRTKCD